MFLVSGILAGVFEMDYCDSENNMRLIENMCCQVLLSLWLSMFVCDSGGC